MKKITRRNFLKASSFSLAVAGLAGCVPSSGETSSTSDVASTDQQSESGSEGIVEVNYWTWFPNQDQLSETIAAFEAENSDIKIKMTVMDSKTFQDKAPLALSTGEEIDIIGVQPSPFAATVEDYLVDLEEFMPTALGDDWNINYNQNILDKGKELTSGLAKFITILNSGSMIGFYNVKLLEELGKEVPTTIDEYEDVANALYAKYPDKLAGVFAGLEAWLVDEMLLTVLTQNGDYYNQFIYDGATLDSQEMVDALAGFKSFFDRGIFSMDIMDLDYASATEMFTNGDALVYYMGSWDATLLSSVLRDKNGIALEDVGAMALPVVYENGQPAVRAYLDCGVGIVEYSSKKEAAAKFVQYISSGDGVSILAKQFAGTPGALEFETDESMLTSPAAKNGWNLIVDLIANAPADRNNKSSYAAAVAGPTIQNVINGTMQVEEAATHMQEEWIAGGYE